MPSCQSFSGFVLDCLHVATPTFVQWDPDIGINLSLQERVTLTGLRVLAAVALAVTATIDLAWWLGMTITIYPMHQTGYKNHLINLTSTLALYALFIPICFGYEPKVDHHRFFCKMGDAALKRSPSRNSWFSKQGDYIHERLALNPQRAAQRFAQQTQAEAAKIAKEGFHPNFASEYYISRGLDLNATKDVNGKTWPIHVAAKTDLGTAVAAIQNLFQAIHSRHPSLQQPLDLNLEDRDGFDALTYTLTGVGFFTMEYNPNRDSELFQMNNRAFYRARMNHYTDSDEIPIVPLLLRKGAVLKEARFQEYFDFVKAARDAVTKNRNPAAPRAVTAAQRTDIGQLHQTHKNSQNRYIRLVASRILPEFLEANRNEFSAEMFYGLCRLRENALFLVQWQPRILQLWHVQYRKYKDSMPDALKTGEGEILNLVDQYVAGCWIEETPAGGGSVRDEAMGQL